ncbi:site-2 protease family protein [Candidatus Saccharibacteria bacterium]|nr:site-2 protease family protein [Candidatus Saccharibacteria bacterium]
MDITYVAIVLGVVLVSMTLHEAMHGFVAYYLGDDTAKLLGRLTLNPIKHIDPFLTILLPLFLAIAGAPIFGGAKPVPFNPTRVRYGEWGAAMVALAGPLTNLLLAFVTFGIYAITYDSMQALAGVFLIATMVNLGFFIFNMIPVPPLDGSRVLYAVAPDGMRRGMELIERNGLIIVFALVLFFSQYIGNFIFGMMQLFIALFSAIFGVPY